MGSYATTTGLQTRLVNVEFDTLTTALVTENINDAEAEVNKYLSKRYSIASIISNPPPLVRALASRLAEAYFWRGNSRGSEESLTRADKIEKPVMQNLKELAAGDANLLDTSGALIAEASSSAFTVLCNTKDYPTTFNEDESTSWGVSSDKLDDIADERD